jgi:hypothetical protein
LSFVLANFGIAIAARMPMMTTTIRSSMRVKPFLLFIDIVLTLRDWDGPSTASAGGALYGDFGMLEGDFRHVPFAKTAFLLEHKLSVR